MTKQDIRDPIDAVLAHREGVHGSYADTSRTAQFIKQALREGTNWPLMRDDQKDALEMIATKLARILSGNPNLADHWDDITGYARLVSRSLHGKEIPAPAKQTPSPSPREVLDTIAKELQLPEGPAQ